MGTGSKMQNSAVTANVWANVVLNDIYIMMQMLPS